MKNKLTNEEIGRVFAMYMPCEFTYENEINNLAAVGGGWVHSDEADESGEGVFGIEDCKLLLTPLSKITDEDTIEVIRIFHSGMGYMSKTKCHKYIQYVKEGGTYEKNVSCFQYLIRRGYAVPLFFGINHDMNGKTAIECGIAIDKTNL